MLYIADENKMMQPLWKIVCQFPRKVKHRVIVYPGNSTPRYMFKNIKNITFTQKHTQECS